MLCPCIRQKFVDWDIAVAMFVDWDVAVAMFVDWDIAEAMVSLLFTTCWVSPERR